MLRRRCVVCHRAIRTRREWRARVMVDTHGRVRPAHWWCVVPDDAMVMRFMEGDR